MKKLIAVMLAVLLVMTMTACGADDGKYVIGICQIQKHAALDAATQGFKDALTEALGAGATAVSTGQQKLWYI